MTAYNFSCFKAYDIRGKIGDELSFDLVYNIGRALAVYLKAKKVVLGCDIRLTSPDFKKELARGLMEMGVDVIDLGTTGTEEIYFATSFLEADGGVEITASHNPKDYNGLKIVSRGSVPLSGEHGLNDIRALIEKGEFTPAAVPGTYTEDDQSTNYVSKLLTFVDPKNIRSDKPLKFLFNIGNGTAGKITKKVIGALKACGAQFDYVLLHEEADGNFPNGIPNPLLIENRKATSQAVVENGCDLGIAFDGDFDRCFFFDEKGNFVDGYYVVGLLTQAFLAKDPSQAIVYEPRLLWNSQAIIKRAGGTGYLSKSGHSFIKRKLREVNAIYSGELSAHHYFRDYYFCDSGMIPWLLVIELLYKTGKPISQLVANMAKEFPCSDEINFKLTDTQAVLDAIKNAYAAEALDVSTIDGLSFEFADWRFNVRTSNTEPLLRLNVESRGNKELVAEKVAEISNLINSVK